MGLPSASRTGWPYQTVYFYDGASRPLGVRDANGKQVRVDYTPLDDVAHVIRYLTGTPVVTQYQYDSERNLRFLTDAMGRTWEWRYDSKNRPIQAIDPLGLSTLSLWDPNDYLVRWQDRKGQVGQYIYGTNGAAGTGDLLTQASFFRKDGDAAESGYSVTYDSTSHLVTGVAETIAGTMSNTFGYRYDAAFRLIGEDWTEPGASMRSVTQALDEIGRRTSLQATGQSAITYVFDPRDDIRQIMQDGLTTNYQYDRIGRLVNRSPPNGVSTAWSFDAAGRLTGLTSSHNGDVIDTHTYVPDAVGNITQDTANGVTMSYQDDDLYRLTQATIGGTTSSWVYDRAGNRLSQTVGGTKTVYGYDPANRMTSVNGAPLAYDANGNLTAYGNDAYTWDVRDRMTGLTRPGLGASFVYDYADRRSSKTVNLTKTSFLYDGVDIVSEISGGSTINTQQSPFVDQPTKRNGLYLTPNHLGSTTTLTDSTGNVAEQYFYMPFGQTWQSAATTSPFQFAGRENDGTGFYFNRARYYSPDLGRFISEDPDGLDEVGNQYPYAGNDPVNFTDPFGEDKLEVGYRHPGPLGGVPFADHATLILIDKDKQHGGSGEIYVWAGFPTNPSGVPDWGPLVIRDNQKTWRSELKTFKDPKGHGLVKTVFNDPNRSFAKDKATLVMIRDKINHTLHIPYAPTPVPWLRRARNSNSAARSALEQGFGINLQKAGIATDPRGNIIPGWNQKINLNIPHRTIH